METCGLAQNLQCHPYTQLQNRLSLRKKAEVLFPGKLFLMTQGKCFKEDKTVISNLHSNLHAEGLSNILY